MYKKLEQTILFRKFVSCIERYKKEYKMYKKYDVCIKNV